MTTGFQVNGVDFDIAFVNKSSFHDYAGLWATGNNSIYQLGDTTTTHRSSPVQTSSGGPLWSNRFAAGGRHSAAIKTDGSLWLWGANDFGQLGDGTLTNRSGPTQTSSANTNWSRIACGQSHTLAIKTDGTLWAWGRNTSGQLGKGNYIDLSSPSQVGTNTDFKVIACGWQHSAAINSSNTLFLWGDNSKGQLGDQTTTNKNSPVQTIASGTNWTQVACGELHTVAIKSDGTLWNWGDNTSGQLGLSEGFNLPRSSPVQTIAGGTNWKKVSAGGYHSLATRNDGTLWGWGDNRYGQLGDLSTSDKKSPVLNTSYTTDWKQVVGGLFHSAAVKNDGTLWSWGYNEHGQLGDGTTTHRSSPVQTIIGGTNWNSVSAGASGYHTVMLRESYW